MIVEIAFAMADQQFVKELQLQEGAVVRDAVVASGFTEQFEQVQLDDTPVGIYGLRVSYDDELQDGDRVELYRPLESDPMEARRSRAKTQRLAARADVRADGKVKLARNKAERDKSEQNKRDR